MIIQSHPNVVRRQLALTTTGIVEVVLKIPFRVLILNVSRRAIHIPKQMYVSYGIVISAETLHI